MGQQDEMLWMNGMDIIRKLGQSGHEAYLVGGCVRDKFIGRSLHDIDIATSAKPEEVMALFSRTLPTGLKHGTVTVMEAGRSFEVTTFRQEFGYSDARRPDEVAFVLDVREDLSRRDFTFNAMAVGLDEEVVDPFGGYADLQAGIVRTVGDASERFNEDALRMLRAIRFAAEFNYQLLSEVWQGIIRQRPKLKQVAMERVSVEWDKMMAGSGPEQACHYLFKSGLLVNVKEPLPVAIQEAAERYRFNKLSWEWDSTFSDIGSLGSHLLRLPLIADPDLRWAALLVSMDVGEQESLDLCRTLRFSGRRVIRIAAVVGMNDKLNALDKSSPKDIWISAVLAYGRSTAVDWLVINEAGNTHLLEERGWLEELPITSISELNLRGDELSSLLGKSPGPWIAVLLRQLLEAVVFEQLPNEKDALLSAAKANRGNIDL
jgi:tRNA nucleotidyltransferase (CCA-adding enzyme)